MPRDTARDPLHDAPRDSGLDEGVYGLVLAIDAPIAPTVGALGTVALDAPAAVYVGSARGPGGYSRVARHRLLAAGERDVRRWHVDHVLRHPAVDVAAVVRSSGEECAVAARHRDPDAGTAAGGEERGHGDAAADPVPGFGASDCDCASHLYRYGDLPSAAAAAAAAHRAAPRWDAAWCNSYQDRDPPSM